MAPQRDPSALLQYCERNATARQQSLMAGSLQTPDRFIAGRIDTPTKQALLLTKLRDHNRASSPASDPFGLTPCPIRKARVPGVASTSNGRGGRVTSGTSAPHYTADFLRRSDDDGFTHEQRLAVAMDVEQSARMLKNSSPPSPSSPVTPKSPEKSDGKRGRTFWNNSAWEQEIMSTPTKIRPKKPRPVPIIPFRVLDAPALRDDYYCSLLSYSPTLKCLAVGLGPHVYLWTESRGKTPTHMPDSLTSHFGAHVTSVSFSSLDGGSTILAIGRADGRITLWSPHESDPRFDSEQPSPISCVCFRPNSVRTASLREPSEKISTEELLVGDEAGHVYLYSVQWPGSDQRDLFDWHGSMTLLAKIVYHTQQVCGLAWSAEGDFFATGGNDNAMFVYERKRLLGRNNALRDKASVHVRNVNLNGTAGSPIAETESDIPTLPPGSEKLLITIGAAVKAIAFAPWQSTLVAAGGGSSDRCIHFYHVPSGAKLATIDCHAQVTSLVWNKKRKCLAATFGFAQPEHKVRVAVFAWPSCELKVGIPWAGEERALWGVEWEGGLVVASSDASIKFHEIWGEDIGSKGGGLLGGSPILEDGVSGELEREECIR